MIIHIVDDDPDVTEALVETLEDEFPDARIKTFETLREASQALSPDFLVIDISAVCGRVSLQHAWAPLASYIDSSPGVTVCLHSALGIRMLEDFRRELQEEFPHSDVVSCGYLHDDHLIETIKQRSGCG